MDTLKEASSVHENSFELPAVVGHRHVYVLAHLLGLLFGGLEYEPLYEEWDTFKARDRDRAAYGG